MKYSSEQKAQLTGFLRDVKTYKQIIADIKKLEDVMQNILNPPALQPFQNEEIEQFRLKYQINQLREQLEKNIKQFVGQDIKGAAPLLTLLNNLNNQAGYDATVAGTLKKSLFDLLKEKSAPHQDYIANRFAQGERKVQKVLNTMPDKKHATRANRLLTFSRATRRFLPVGALITELVTMLALLAVGLLVPAIPTLTLAAIVATTALVCMLGLVIAPFLASKLAANKAKPIQHIYNGSLVKAQRTLNRAIDVENTYTLLVQEGISIMPADITLDPSVEKDPLLTNQQGSVFSINATLEKGQIPELNEVQYTWCII